MGNAHKEKDKCRHVHWIFCVYTRDLESPYLNLDLAHTTWFANQTPPPTPPPGQTDEIGTPPPPLIGQTRLESFFPPNP